MPLPVSIQISSFLILNAIASSVQWYMYNGAYYVVVVDFACYLIVVQNQTKNRFFFLNCWTILSAGIKKLSENTLFPPAPNKIMVAKYMCCKCSYYYYYYYYIEYLVHFSVNMMLLIPANLYSDEHATYMIVFQIPC